MTIFTSSILWQAFFLLSFISISISDLQYSLPTKEYNALFDLFEGTNGENWQWLSPTSLYGFPWNFSSTTAQNPCSSSHPWQGITCTSSCGGQPCNVMILALEHFELQGSIPLSMGNLTALTELHLCCNQLTGSIPSTLGNLQQLSRLDLSMNQLTSSIPESLGFLNKLKSLLFNRNRLRGKIPESFGNFSKVEVLSLYQNRLTGPLPSCLGNMTALTYLYLFQNELTGLIPISLNRLSQLANLYLYNNELTHTSLFISFKIFTKSIFRL
jgi:Leucine-rich repeat (LRR) protein